VEAGVQLLALGVEETVSALSCGAATPFVFCSATRADRSHGSSMLGSIGKCLPCGPWMSLPTRASFASWHTPGVPSRSGQGRSSDRQPGCSRSEGRTSIEQSTVGSPAPEEADEARFSSSSPRCNVVSVFIMAAFLAATLAASLALRRADASVTRQRRDCPWMRTMAPLAKPN